MGGWAIWAQATGSGRVAVALLALRRWCGSLTLSSPEAMPDLAGAWAWLGGLGALLVVAMAAQGPVRALGQLCDLAGHARLVAAALRRLRRAGRLVAVLLGASVLSWTAHQMATYNAPEGLDDLAVLRRSRNPGMLAAGQGVLAGLTPLRDVVGMGDLMVLLAAAAALVFKASADRWAAEDGPSGLAPAPPLGSGATAFWGAAWLYALYRLAARVAGADGFLYGCGLVEVGLVPAMMALSDGLLLGWALTELREAGLGRGEALDVVGAVRLAPAATLACLLAMPGRYVAWGAMLYLVGHTGGVPGSTYERLGRAVIALQGAALVTAGMAGAVAWSRGAPLGALRGYGRLLAAEGGRLVAVLGLAGLAAAAPAGAAYALVLALPSQPWVLMAADAYAHYATLPVGLATLAALVDLGQRALPLAKPVAPAAPNGFA